LLDLNGIKEAATVAGISSGALPKPGKDDNTTIKIYMEFLAKNKKIDKIKYVDFINKYGVLTVYIIIAIILVPASYFILRRQDFR
jgi:hypothetical protein